MNNTNNQAAWHLLADFSFVFNQRTRVLNNEIFNYLLGVFFKTVFSVAVAVACVTLASGQQPQEPSGSWQQVVSSGHSDSWSGQMTAFSESSWSCSDITNTTAREYQRQEATANTRQRILFCENVKQRSLPPGTSKTLTHGKLN